MSQRVLSDTNSLRAELIKLFRELGKGTKEDAKSAVTGLISQCRKTLNELQDDGLGPRESHELEFAQYLALTYDLLKPALIWAYVAMEICEVSSEMSDTGFYAFLA
jgi:hypothetical protein